MKILWAFIFGLFLTGTAAAQDFTFHGCSSCSPGCPSMCPRHDPPEHRNVNHYNPPPQPSPEELAKQRDLAMYNQYSVEWNGINERWNNIDDSQAEVDEWNDFYDKTGWDSAL